MTTKLDLTGIKNNRLTGVKNTNKKYRTSFIWLFKCDCGNYCEVPVNSFKSGNTKSCGCYSLESCKTRFLTHGYTVNGKSSEYNTWENIKGRCNNPNNQDYKNYGGRGIKVCDRWFNNFENFLKDMGKRPDGYSIERIDVNGDYEPSNCKWIPLKEQGKNKTNSIIITHDRMTKTLKQWADFCEIKYHTLKARYRKGVRPPELFYPVD